MQSGRIRTLNLLADVSISIGCLSIGWSIRFNGKILDEGTKFFIDNRQAKAGSAKQWHLSVNNFRVIMCFLPIFISIQQKDESQTAVSQTLSGQNRMVTVELLKKSMTHSRKVLEDVDRRLFQ
jgi:hypothetical protein